MEHYPKEKLEVDHEALRKERQREAARAALRKQRLRAVAGEGEADCKTLDSEGSQEDLELQLSRAAEAVPEASMSIFRAGEVPAEGRGAPASARTPPSESAGSADTALPYQGKVYKGMAVRPRGCGTPRRKMLAGEVYRSSLEVQEKGEGYALSPGRVLSTRPHYQVPDENHAEVAKADAPKQRGILGWFH
ncbi:unnamed protein product [Symbiodinium natans]|uniref:Uncharacterized protein n=1 Tax=Symbiodinium natans TaxID=878477 RepID=A0A812QZ98_9DINO|nr:unnamed protein product [Symbiodinium natans]